MGRTKAGRGILVLALAFAALSGCGGPRVRPAPTAVSPEVAQERSVEQKLVIQTRLARIARLDAVAYPMWTKGNSLCGSRTGYNLWAHFETLAQVRAFPG